MFTPPPSPSPPRLKFQQSNVNHLDLATDSPISPSSPTPKRASSQRTKWTVLVVPLVLILITGTTRYLTHPAAFDVLSGLSNQDSWKPALTDWRPHKRHPDPQAPTTGTSGSSIAFPTAPPTSSTPLSASTSATTTPAAAAQAVPTIPSVAPALPSPFPQAFDTTLQANFSTQGCENFFLNMSTTPAFISCRPFSLLLQNSQAFNQQAQTNLTALSSIVWGTCNTDLSQDVCSSNMAWFASTLQSVCAEDLSARNVMVSQTLQGLQAFDLMRTAGCLPDQTTNTYCFVEAAHSSNPADLYFYQLPIGISLPNGTTPSCSSCAKSLLALYSQALQNATKGTLDDLQKTYASGATLADKQCGAGYAQASATGGALGRETWSAAVSMTAILLTWVVLLSVP